MSDLSNESPSGHSAESNASFYSILGRSTYGGSSHSSMVSSILITFQINILLASNFPGVLTFSVESVV